MNYKRSGVLLMLILLIVGCVSSPDQTQPKAWLKPGVRVDLPQPMISEPINQQQLLTATAQGKQQSLLVLLHADGQRLTLVGLSPLGIRLFKVSYDKRGIQLEQSIKIVGLPPANQVLADIMLSYWPIESWRPLLPANWRLVDEGDKRRLFDDKDQIVTEISYQMSGSVRKPVAIEQFVFHYFISIQNVEG
ncbi:putative lipoprotein [Yersinia rohdei]|nr:putative lipoprotein [Yersinia rohdei]CNJ25441.1 putative lipoprotein [Yersinia rohdei]